MRSIVPLVLTIITMGLTSGGNTSMNYVEDFRIMLHEALTSLSKLLDYMQKPSDVVGDLIFGIVLSAGQLSILKQHLLQKDIGNEIVNPTIISELEQKCRNIYKKLLATRTDDKSDYDTIISYIVRQDLWEVDIPIVQGKLKKPSSGRRNQENPSHLSKLSYKDLLLMGTPKELQSDECIAELVRPQLCELSENCENIMTNSNEVHGYPLTHRLLYFQTAKRLGCGNYSKFGDVQEQIVDLCSDILEENHYIIKLGIPPEFRDLFLEQCSLCGMEGFAEFLNPYYIQWVQEQQTFDGCFTENKEKILANEAEERQHPRRIKREDGTLGDSGCTMHITGMAAVFLSMNIRALVDYWSNYLELQ